MKKAHHIGDPKPRKRESARQRERRACTQAVLSNTAQRTAPTETQIASFFRAIDSNNLTGFGIRLLSTLQIDSLHFRPDYAPWEPHLTLIAYAAWRARPRFVKSLLRSGADPSIRVLPTPPHPPSTPSTPSTPPDPSPSPASTLPRNSPPTTSPPSEPHIAVDLQVYQYPGSKAGPRLRCFFKVSHVPPPDEKPAGDKTFANSSVRFSHSPRAREYLAEVPIAYAVWIVQAVMRMRFAGCLAAQRNRNPGSEVPCPRCEKPILQPVGWACGHLCCESCLWECMGSSSNSVDANGHPREDLSCFVCGLNVAESAEENKKGTATGDVNGHRGSDGSDVLDGIVSGKKDCGSHRRKVERIGEDELRQTGKHPDDWECRHCQYPNFAYRTVCRNCTTVNFPEQKCAQSIPSVQNQAQQLRQPLRGYSSLFEDNYRRVIIAGAIAAGSAAALLRGATLPTRTQPYWKLASVAGIAIASAAWTAYTRPNLSSQNQAVPSPSISRSDGSTVPQSEETDPTAVNARSSNQSTSSTNNPTVKRESLNDSTVPTDPKSRKERSYEKWLELPEDLWESQKESSDAPEYLDGAQVRRRVRREKFEALPLHAAARAFMGNTKSQRSQELRRAAQEGQVPRLAALLSAGVDVDAANEYGQTALFLASWHGHATAVGQLLEFGASVSRGCNGGCHPLTAAVAAGHLDVLTRLLTADDLDPAQIGSHGQTALHWAGQTGASEEIVDLLASHPCYKRPITPQESVALFGPTIQRRLPELTGCRVVTELVPGDSASPGRGSYHVDGGLSEGALTRIENLWASLPVAEKAGTRGSDCIIHRSYFCDAEGWLCGAIEEALQGTLCTRTHRCVRFLHYFEVGGSLPPHLDLPKIDETGKKSTHTLLLYLADCKGGGETVLLDRLDEGKTLARVEPRRGRLFIFPHDCPHKAEPVLQVPKLVLRGEACIQ